MSKRRERERTRGEPKEQERISPRKVEGLEREGIVFGVVGAGVVVEVANGTGSGGKLPSHSFP